MKDGDKHLTNPSEWKIADDVAPYMNATGMQMMSEDRLNKCLDAIGAYLQTSDKAEQISAWIYLTGNYGWYWLSNLTYNSDHRYYMYALNDICCFD